MNDYTDQIEHEPETELKTEKTSKANDKNKYLIRRKIEDLLDDIELKHRIENIFSITD